MKTPISPTPKKEAYWEYIALIGIERSLGAWNLLYPHAAEHQDELIGLMAALERTRQLALQHFPEAPAFRRPGFDD